MDFEKRSYQKELLDRDDIPFDAIERNMQELDVINTWLGGHAITVHGLKALIVANKPLHVCEIGCGGGDNLSALAKWCARKNIAVRFTGIDINPFCIAVAKASFSYPQAEFITSDYKLIDFGNEKPDVIFSSLFCHHFMDDELIFMLNWMNRNAGSGFFINDLHRHPLAYYSIKLLTAAFSKSYLVKNDAPLSVLRGFSRREWITLLEKADIRQYRLQWKWAFRWLITART